MSDDHVRRFAFDKVMRTVKHGFSLYQRCLMTTLLLWRPSHRHVTTVCWINKTYSNAGVLARAAACAGIDDTDRCIPTDWFKIIKATIVVKLEYHINKKLKELCLGCEVDHPSQLLFV